MERFDPTTLKIKAPSDYCHTKIKMALTKNPINITKMLQVILIAFAGVELLSFVVSSISPSVPFIKGGFLLILFGVIIFLSYLWSFAINIKDINLKRDIPILLFLIGVVGLLYYIMPLIVPQLFSVVEGSAGQQTREYLNSILGSVVSTRTGVLGSIGG